MWDEERKPLNMDKVAQIRTRIRHFEESHGYRIFLKKIHQLKYR
nr:hypothetical protein [Candidatus Coxiella mudrowiae]